MLMVLAMCLSLLPASTLAATLNGTTVTELGTGAYSITLKNDCDAAVKYSVTLNGTTTEVTLNGGDNLTLRGNADDTYSVKWEGGASEDYSYTEPETKEKSGRFWQAASLYDGFDGADGKTYSNTQASNATLTCSHNGLTYSPDFYYLTGVEGSVITFYSEGRGWGGYSYVRESDGKSYSGGLTGGRGDARNEALKANGVDPNAEDRYYNYEANSSTVAMWVYWKATPYISFTSTAELLKDQTDTFKVAALNVDGMPEKVDVTALGFNATSINLNSDGPQSEGSKLIGQYIEDSGIDILGLSENFNYYTEINTNAPSYDTGTQRLPGGIQTEFNLGEVLRIDFPFDTDGLNLMYKDTLTVSGETMVSWNDHYSPNDPEIPVIDVPSLNGADGMIDKGYRFYQVKVADGVVVDVYILHMDAETDPGDNEARSKQIDQLMAAVEANDNGNPIIIMGDTNCRYTRDPLEEKIIVEGGFSDPWIDLKKGGTYPKVGDQALMVTPGDNASYQTNEIVDKVFYKNAEGSNLTIEAVSYDVDADGYTDADGLLGDHPPVIVEFKYTLKSNTTQHTHNWDTDTWDYDAGYHWHECLNDNCDVTMNSEKKDYAAHTFTETVTTEPTCTTDGSKTLKCSVCGYETTEVIPAKGHSYSAAWTSDGTNHWHVCTVEGCGATTTPEAHSWNEGVVTTPATATTAGERTYTCTVCQATKKETIPATGQFNYTFVVDFPEEHYDVGDTVTADIYIKSNDVGANFMTYNFNLVVPQGLTLSQLTKSNSLTGEFTFDNFSAQFSSNSQISLTPGEMKQIATATFTVSSTVTDQNNVTLTLSDARVGNEHTQDDIIGAITSDATTLHNITVTLNPGNATINGKNEVLTLYAKYNESDLYSNPARTEKVTSVDLDANEGYRLADTQWSGNMASFTDIAGQTFTASQSYTVQTVKTYKVSFVAGEHVTSLTGTTEVVVDINTTFDNVTKPGYTLPNNNYTFDGWFKDDDTEMGDSEAITSDLTLTAKASAKQVTFSQSTENATIYDLTGVINGKATYDTDITFTVAPADGQYVIDSVTYTVGEGTAAQPLNADDKGVYTIDGEKITGPITVYVEAIPYYTVTFEAGEGTTLDGDASSYVAYVKSGQSVLYTDDTFTDKFSVPNVSNAEGYRLAKDTGDEPLWKDTNDTGYQSTALGSSSTFTQNTTLFAQAIQQVTVTFNPGEGTFAYGTTTTYTLDKGKTLTTEQIPTGTAIIAPAGYQFDSWSSDVNAAITTDTTFTAQYTDGSYTLTLPTTSGVTFDVEGATLNEGVYTVTHGTSVTITMNVTGNVKVTELSYQIGSNGEVIVADNDGGITSQAFTIAGDQITGAISVTIESTETYQITVTVSDGNGKVNGQDEVTLTVDKGTTAEQLASMFTFEPNPGYKVDAITPAFDIVNGNTNYTVTFTHDTYSVTWPANATGTLPETLTHGQDFTFTPSVPGKLVTGVTYQVGDGGAVTLPTSSTGSYTIPGNAITGPITVTYTTVDATWDFITETAYKAAPEGKQVAILNASKLETGTYALDGYGDMFWSEKYSGYVYFVDNNETATTLTQKLVVSQNNVTEIDYSGDINDNGIINAVDTGSITAVLHQIPVEYTISDMQRFQFDVNGDRKVTTQDIKWILDTAVGKNPTSSSNP